MASVSVTAFAQKETPYIQQLYSSFYDSRSNGVKCLPSANPYTRGAFVDWGTRMYELEMELQKKCKEVVELEQKLTKSIPKRPYKEVTKKGQTPKMQNYRDRLMKNENQLILKREELKWEKQRSKSLLLEVNELKATVRKYKAKRMISKSTQTTRASTKSVQTQSHDFNLAQTRTISTQYISPQMTVKINQPFETEYGTIFDKNLVHNEPTTLDGTVTDNSNTYQEASEISAREIIGPKDMENVKYATAINIKSPKQGLNDSPLEMSLVQKFGEGKVQTLVQSNKKFHITEKALTVPTVDQINKAITTFHQHKNALMPNSPSPTTSYQTVDSGVSSEFEASRPPSAEVKFNEKNSRINSRKVQFPQCHQHQPNNQANNKKAFESSIPRYINRSQQVGQSSILKRRPQTAHSSENSRSRDTQKSAIQTYSAPPRKHPDYDRIPYPFLRNLMNQDLIYKKEEKPVFFHTSEIQLYKN